MFFVKNAGPKSGDIRGAKIAKIMVAHRTKCKHLSPMGHHADHAVVGAIQVVFMLLFSGAGCQGYR